MVADHWMISWGVLEVASVCICIFCHFGRQAKHYATGNKSGGKLEIIKVVIEC